MNLQGVKKIFLDTAPVIYMVECNPRYLPIVRPVFANLDEGLLQAVTSPVTLAECLVYPYQTNQMELVRRFAEMIVHHRHTTFVPIDSEISHEAAQLRARHNLSLTDAYQIATCLASKCDAFLTNDLDLKRVREVNVLVVEEIS